MEGRAHCFGATGMLGLIAVAVFYAGLVASMLVIAAAVPIALIELEANWPHARPLGSAKMWFRTPFATPVRRG